MEAPHIDAAAVIDILDALSGASVTCWLDGGWAVDALLGEQTREHSDLDLVVAEDDVARIIVTLEAKGFAIDVDERPISFTMGNASGATVDLHPVRWDESGGGVQAQPRGTTFTYPAKGFTGIGTIAGHSVRCLTAEVQILCHGGYELDDDDHRDVAALSHWLAQNPGAGRLT